MAILSRQLVSMSSKIFFTSQWFEKKKIDKLWVNDFSRA